MTVALDNSTWELRGYQREAIDLFDKSGAGVVVLPCGAGKTVVGIGAMVEGQSSTLILVTNSVSARQWRDEIIARSEPRRHHAGKLAVIVGGDLAGGRPADVVEGVVGEQGQGLSLSVLDRQDADIRVCRAGRPVDDVRRGARVHLHLIHLAERIERHLTRL